MDFLGISMGFQWIPSQGPTTQAVASARACHQGAPVLPAAHAASADGAHGLAVQHLHHVGARGLVLVQQADAVGGVHQGPLVGRDGQRHEED